MGVRISDMYHFYMSKVALRKCIQLVLYGSEEDGMLVRVQPYSTKIGIVDKMEKSREWNPVQLNYLELALPRKLCL